MMRKILMTVSMIALVGTAHATPINSNDHNYIKSDVSNSSQSTGVGIGIGKGGNARSNSKATGGSASIGDTSIRNVDRSSTELTNQQGQKQSQVGEYHNNTSANSEGSQSHSSNSLNVHDDGDISTFVSAPSLTATDDTCMGSKSFGGSAAGFGLTAASTWKDEDCVMRKDARLLHNMGMQDAALQLLCQKESLRKALTQAGKLCYTDSIEVDAVPTNWYTKPGEFTGVQCEYPDQRNCIR